MNPKKTYYLLLSCIILLAFAIRLLGINQPFNEDELHWAYSAEVRDWFGTITFNTPLSMYFLNTFTTIFGVSTETIRLSFVIIGIITILITTKFAAEKYNKKTAIIAALLLAINPLHVLASLQAAYEGSTLTLFFITTLFFLTRNSNLLTGTSFGMAVLSKLSALFIIPPIIFLHFFSKNHTVLKSLKKTFIITLIAMIPLILFFALPSILTDSPALVNSIIKLLSKQTNISNGISGIVMQYGHAFVWLGPILTFLPILALRYKTKNRLHFIAIIITVIFYFLLTINTAPPIERYWMILLPSLSIISAHIIAQNIKKEKKTIILLVTTCTLAFIIAICINLPDAENVPFYPKQKFIDKIFSLEFNWLIPLTGSSGPLGFYINAINPTIFTFTALLLLMILLFNTKHKITILLLFLGISTGYQLFFVQEYLLSLTQPNIPHITQKTIEYINTNNLQEPIYYFKNYALFYHFDKKYYEKKQPITLPSKFNYLNKSAYDKEELKNKVAKTVYQSWYPGFVSLSFVDDDENRSNMLLEQFKKNSGTVVFIDFPTLNKQGPLWKTIQQCNEIKKFSDKGKTVAYIFDCDKLKHAKASSAKETNEQAV